MVDRCQIEYFNISITLQFAISTIYAKLEGQDIFGGF